MNARRFLGVVFIAGAFVAVSGAPALATLTESKIRCDGSAVVTAEKFSVDETPKTYSVNARQAKVTLPRSGSAAWKGSTAPVSHDHHGSVWVDVGIKDIEMVTWSSKNDQDKPASAGVKRYNIPKWVPPFELKIAGEHIAKEGSCSGTITLDLDGSVLSSWAGLTITGGFIAATGLFVSAGFAKGRP